ncbi:MAG: RNA methyltransferase [Deltaproteobacteria bacterium]|jgi:tRNA G18 (ribose-2'-O)-methylase SpoU|nr:RNA methyltransferase [Deltaproteobacteria bacterium]
MQSQPVADFDDPRIADYRNLKDATLASSRQRFIVEGRGNLRVLLTRSAYRPDSILLNERSWAALAPELEAVAPDCPIYVAEQPVLDRVVGFSIHRGCLAACARSDPRDPLELARSVLAERAAPRLVVLEGLTNHDNVGGIFRNAMALGGDGVLLCPRSCDPLYRKAIRTSMGGSLCVPFSRSEDLWRTLAALRGLGFEILALDPGDPGVEIRTLDAAGIGAAALVLGTEGPGLTPATLACADRRVRIAMEPGVDSLNVSAAAGIALYQLRRERTAAAARVGGEAR